MFIGWSIPNSPLSVLANHPRPTFLSAEIHPKSQCPFLLYLSLGQVSIAFLGMRDHSLSGAASPSNQAPLQSCLYFPPPSSPLVQNS